MLYKSETFELLELLDIVGIFFRYCSMGPRGRFYPYLYHVIYWTALDRFHAGIVIR